MKTGVLFSGGKDSCLVLHKFLQEQGKVDVLLSVIPENEDSFMFHKPDKNLLKRQAEMLGLPLITEKTKGEKEQELEDLRRLIEKSRVNKLVVGGIKSSYQASRIKKICRELGIKMTAPLWNYDAEKLWSELLDNGFKVIITKISCEGIGKEWTGKVIDEGNFKLMRKLAEKFKFQLDFEGGEAETAVLWMPGMKQEIKIEFDVKSEGQYRHFMKITEVS